MALNYTQLFGDIGKFIKIVDQYRELAVGFGGLTRSTVSGTHTGSSGASVLTDSTKSWGANALVGMTIYNETDGSVGVISANTSTTVTTFNGLSGGTDDDWDTNDVYSIRNPVPDVPALQSELETQLVASGRYDVLEGTYSTFESQKDTLVSLAETIAAKVTERILNRESVINELNGSPSVNSISDTLYELTRQMVDDSESINAASVTTGSVTADAGNNSAGEEVFRLATLDGYTPPGTNMASLPHYVGISSQLAREEVMTLTVTQDRDNNGLPLDQAVLVVEGQPAPDSAFGWRSEGSGSSMTLQTLDSYSTIQNRGFESWAAGAPSSWTIENGTATVEIIQESTAADVFTGSYSLELAGTSTDAEIRQAVSGIIPNRMYVLAVAVKGNASADGTLTIKFVSDSGGYTASGSEDIVMNAAALQAQTTYGMESFYGLTPATIPDDLELMIQYASGTTASIHLDALAFGPLQYTNGIGFAIKSGSTEMVIGDRWTFDVTVDESVFQRFFRKFYGVQLPSNNAGAETIPDSWAT